MKKTICEEVILLEDVHSNSGYKSLVNAAYEDTDTFVGQSQFQHLLDNTK